jgi:hypothetical protein
MTFFEKIAKEAFMQVMAYGLFNITPTSGSVNTIHLNILAVYKTNDQVFILFS